MFACVALATSNATAEEPSKSAIRITSSGNTDLKLNGEYVWLDAFMRSSERSGFKIIFHPGSSLGKESERTELVNLNLVQVNISGLSEIQAYSPLAQGLSIPFLFEDYDQFDRFLDETSFLDEVNAELSQTNMLVVDAVLLGGMSGLFTTSDRVASPQDLRGVRLRAMSRSDMEMLDSWGAKGVQVAWEEVAQALETGIAHGYLNPPLAPLMFGHAAQIHYFSDLRLYPSTRWVIVSRRWYEGLSETDRIALRQAIPEGRKANRAWTQEAMRNERQALEAAKISYTPLKEGARAQFAELTDAPYRETLMPAVFAHMQDLLEQLESDQ